MKLKKYNIVDALEAIIDYRGRTPNKSETGIPTLSAKSVKMGYIDYDQCYFISPKEYESFMVRGFPRKGDVLVTTEAPLGVVAQLDRDDVAIAQRLLTIRGKKGVLDNAFLFYYLQSSAGQQRLIARQSGSTVMGIRQEEFRKIEIEIPSFQIQQQIASVLSNLDRKIALNRAINRNLEALAKQLYDYWFVQFDFPDENGRPYKSSGGKMVWNEVLKREVPEGWKVKRLEEVLNNKNKSTTAGNHLHGLDYCPIDVIPMRTMSFASGKSYEEANSSLQLYDYKDILIGAMRVYFHRCCIASKPGVTRTTTMVLCPLDTNQLGYLYQVCNEEKTFEYAIKVSTGTQQPYVTWPALKKCPFAYPDNKVLIDLYCKKTMPIIDMVLKNVVEIQLLTRQRDELLPLLMNGQVTIE